MVHSALPPLLPCAGLLMFKFSVLFLISSVVKLLLGSVQASSALPFHVCIFGDYGLIRKGESVSRQAPGGSI